MLWDFHFIDYFKTNHVGFVHEQVEARFHVWKFGAKDRAMKSAQAQAGLKHCIEKLVELGELGDPEEAKTTVSSLYR